MLNNFLEYVYPKLAIISLYSMLFYACCVQSRVDAASSCRLIQLVRKLH